MRGRKKKRSVIAHFGRSYRLYQDLLLHFGIKRSAAYEIFLLVSAGLMPGSAGRGDEKPKKEAFMSSRGGLGRPDEVTKSPKSELS